ncbi:MAG: DUF6588 family protein [Bacteroidota bacterium]
MKNLYSITKALLLCLFLFSFNCIAYSQSHFVVISNIIQAGFEDANIFCQAYVNPLGKALASDLSGGWYGSAQVHEAGGFDLTYNFHYSQTPNVDGSFDLSNIGLIAIRPVGVTLAPTITNGNDVTTTNVFYTNPNGGADIKLFDEDITISGIDRSFGSPLPTFDIGFGIPFHTEIRARIIPRSDFKDYGLLNLWGLGIKHEFSKWIPFLEEYKINASLLFAYSKLKMDAGLDYEPNAGFIETSITLPENQQFSLDASSFVTNLIISSRFSFISPYISGGFSRNNYEYKLLGTYYYALPNSNTGNFEILNDDQHRMINPITFTSDFGFKPQFAIGVSLELVFLNIHAQYTIQEYNMFSAGIGISVR